MNHSIENKASSSSNSSEHKEFSIKLLNNMKGKLDELEAQRKHPHHKQGHHCNDEKEEKEEEPRRGCRPIACFLGFPFAISAFLLSLAAGIVWILGSLLSYVCPCLSCCADVANKAMDIIKLPIDVFRWFIDKIPC